MKGGGGVDSPIKFDVGESRRDDHTGGLTRELRVTGDEYQAKKCVVGLNN